LNNREWPTASQAGHMLGTTLFVTLKRSMRPTFGTLKNFLQSAPIHLEWAFCKTNVPAVKHDKTSSVALIAEPAQLKKGCDATHNPLNCGGGNNNP
jgi:hypothetical protein